MAFDLRTLLARFFSRGPLDHSRLGLQRACWSTFIHVPLVVEGSAALAPAKALRLPAGHPRREEGAAVLASQVAEHRRQVGRRVDWIGRRNEQVDLLVHRGAAMRKRRTLKTRHTKGRDHLDR